MLSVGAERVLELIVLHLKYEVRRVAGNAGWYVIITHENAPAEEWFGFASEAHAWDWLQKEMDRRDVPSQVLGFPGGHEFTEARQAKDRDFY